MEITNATVALAALGQTGNVQTLSAGEASAFLTSLDEAGRIPPAHRAAARAAVWDAFFRQDLELLPASLPDALRAQSSALLTDFTAQDYALLGEILEFLASRIQKSVRRLEGALLRVATFTSLSGDMPDIAKIEQLLRDILREETSRILTVDSIQKRVADFYELKVSDLTGKRRPNSIAFPRQIAMYLSRRLTERSLKDIGQAFGGRDHGTVIHANKLVASRMEEDVRVRDIVQRLEEELRD